MRYVLALALLIGCATPKKRMVQVCGLTMEQVAILSHAEGFLIADNNWHECAGWGIAFTRAEKK